jgi:hypothetical protein
MKPEVHSQEHIYSEMLAALRPADFVRVFNQHCRYSACPGELNEFGSEAVNGVRSLVFNIYRVAWDRIEIPPVNHRTVKVNPLGRNLLHLEAKNARFIALGESEFHPFPDV